MKTIQATGFVPKQAKVQTVDPVSANVIAVPDAPTVEKKSQYVLVAVFEENSTGVLGYRKEGEETWTVFNVSITPWLMKAICDNIPEMIGLPEGHPIVNHVFTADDDSEILAECPFCFTEFKPVKGSDIPIHYELDALNGPKRVAVSVRNNITNTYRKEYRDVRLKSSEYYRWEVKENTLMFDELSDWMKGRVIAPEKQTEVLIEGL